MYTDDDVIDPEDLAPDGDDPGDALPEELKDLVHSAAEDIVADNIDQEKEQ